MVFQGEYPITKKELYQYREPGDLYPRDEEVVRLAQEGYYNQNAGVDHSMFLPLVLEWGLVRERELALEGEKLAVEKMPVVEHGQTRQI